MGTFDALRKEYMRRGLHESELAPDPFIQFRAWFDEASATDMFEPNAMTVATATPEGRPSARMALLKGLDERGFVFYTNYESRKGAELTTNPFAALVFFWAPLERQVRIEGAVERVAEEESGNYFASRPEGSQLGAWASRQSSILPSREALEARYDELASEYAGAAIPRPPYWGGFRVIPDTLEFWQGRESRLHDRLRYVRQEGGAWRIERLSP